MDTPIYFDNGVSMQVKLVLPTEITYVTYRVKFTKATGVAIAANTMRLYFYINSQNTDLAPDIFGTANYFQEERIIKYGGETEDGNAYFPSITDTESPHHHRKFTSCVVVNNTAIPSWAGTWEQSFKIKISGTKPFGLEYIIPSYSTYGYTLAQATSYEKYNSQLVRAIEYRHSYSFPGITTSFLDFGTTNGVDGNSIVAEALDGSEWKLWEDTGTSRQSRFHPFQDTEGLDRTSVNDLARAKTYKKVTAIPLLPTSSTVEDADTYIDILGTDSDHKGESQLILSRDSGPTWKKILMRFDTDTIKGLNKEFEYAELWSYVETYNAGSMNVVQDYIEVLPLKEDTEEWYNVGEDAKRSNINGQEDTSFNLTQASGLTSWFTSNNWIRFQSFLGLNQGLHKYLDEIRQETRVDKGVIFNFHTNKIINQDNPQFASQQSSNTPTNQSFILVSSDVQINNSTVGQPSNLVVASNVIDIISLPAEINMPSVENDRLINLRNFLPSSYDKTDVSEFIGFFEDFLNNDIYTHKTDGEVSRTNVSILKKIELLDTLKDPYLIDEEYINFFAKQLGYNVTYSRKDVKNITGDTNDKDINGYLRQTIQSLPHWYGFKSTNNAIVMMMYSFGIISDIINLWTKDYESDWEIEDPAFEQDTRVGYIPKKYYPTPHFKVLINSSRTPPGWQDHIDNIIKLINDIKPINTVFEGFTTKVFVETNPNHFPETNVSLTVVINSNKEYTEVMLNTQTV